MREIPGLAQDILDRAGVLAAQAYARQETLRPTGAGTPPRADMTPPVTVNGVARMRLYSTIDPDGGYWGTSAGEFADALDSLDPSVSEIELHINSRGGSVWDGLTMLNSLRQHDAKVTAIVEGIAASAASFIACACDELVMMPNSKMMIHDAMGICAGQAQDMHAYGDFLSDSSDNIAAIYAAKAGGDVATWRETMQASGLLGQWYSAQEAVDAGLADRVDVIEDDPANKGPQMLACGCGPDLAGLEHKDECPSKPATPAPASADEAPTPTPTATFDYSRKHGRKARESRVRA